MTRKLIATLLAAAIAFTSFGAAPAYARNDDVARIIIGGAALAIIGSALAAEQRKNNNGQVTRQYHRNYGRHDGRGRHNGYNRHQYAKVLPAACYVRTEVNRRRAEGFSYSCIERSVRNAHVLPRNCIYRTSAHRGPGYIYGANCMRNHGYVVGRH